MHAAVLQALDAGIKSIRAGASGRDVHNGVCQVLVDRGFGTTTKGFEGVDGAAKMNHSTGHGVGLDVHEEPALRGPDENILLEGAVVTAEPGLYLMGLGGVRIEDTGMVTAGGLKNCTTLTRNLDPRDYLESGHLARAGAGEGECHGGGGRRPSRAGGAAASRRFNRMAARS